MGLRSWDALSARQTQLAIDAGALSVLPIVLSTRVGVHLFAGELTVAASLVHEVEAVTEVTGSSIAPYGALGLAAFRGREAEASEMIEAAAKEVVRRGEGEGLTFVQWATAVLNNGLGRYEDALAAAEQAAEASREQWFSTWGLVELIEAATRSGKDERAADALERLTEATRASGTAWARGTEARSRALLSAGEAAETLYRQAIEALEGTRLRVDVARAHLLYGEWLRRERRRLDARKQLRSAHGLFTEFGMEAFAERARMSSTPPASTHANGLSTRATSSPRKKRRSPASPQTEPPTRRSRRGYSSARAPSTTTSARRSASSG